MRYGVVEFEVNGLYGANSSRQGKERVPLGEGGMFMAFLPALPPYYLSLLILYYSYLSS